MDFDKRKIVGFFSVLVVLLGMYLYTIAPTVSLWDCGEFIACSHILGVPHPPGTPFFILIGRIFDILFPFGEVAKRINFLSALSTAIAGGFLYLIILKVVHRFTENRYKRLPLSTHLIAVFSAIGAGFAYSVWDTSVEAEVYATSILILALGLWLTLYWDEHRKESGDNNFLLLLIYLIFLSFGVHLLPLLLIPGILVFLLMTDWKVLKDPRLIGMAIVLILIGISTYLYLMIRAHANPAINEVNPTTISKLMDVILRKQYGPMKMLPRKTQIQTHLALVPAFFEQIRIFFKYFTWQFFPYPREATNLMLRWLSIIGTYVYVLMGLWGMFIHFRKDRKSFWLIFILYMLLSFGLVFYLNLKFSPSDPNPAHQGREVRERDYFWTAAFFFFMFYVSIGLYWIYGWLKERAPRYGWSGIALAVLIGILPAISNIKSHVNRRGNWIAHDYAYNLLRSPRPYSVLFTYGDNDTFPVWFLQQVKGYRKFDPVKKKGIKIGNFSLMNTQWYIKQMIWAGVPMDFASPFKGTQYEGKYLQERRMGKTNKDFQEWVIDHLYYLRGEDRSIIYLKDMAVRNIIVSSLGRKPALRDLLMPIDSFVSKYITEDFNPSINIYFSFPMEPGAARKYHKHLVMEGFAYRLVGRKGIDMMDKEKMWDLFQNEYHYSYIDNYGIYTAEAQNKVLNNHSLLLLLFGNKILYDFPTDEWKERKLYEAEKDTLRMLGTIFKRAFLMAKRSEMSVPIIRGLQKVYSILDETEEMVKLSDWLLSVNDTPLLHLFRGEMLLMVAKQEGRTEEAERVLKEAKEEFDDLLLNKEMEPFAYKGLFDVYSISNNREKMEEIADEMIGKPEVMGNLLSYLIRYDTAKAIFLLEHWKNRYPGDARIEMLLRKLKKGSGG